MSHVWISDPDSLQDSDELIGSDAQFEMEPVEKDPIMGTVLAEKYHVIGLLGSGGMSTVYRARRLPSYSVAAVKVLHRHLSLNRTTLEKFEREARVISELGNPHVVRVEAFGLADHGQPFMVLEILDGRNLSDEILGRGRLSVERAINIFIQAADGLQCAHENGVIHRDLKPSNVMLLNSQDGDFVKIVDFGIARILSEYGENLEQYAQTAKLTGSPIYMSPEQCRGKTVDARSDIYSLGVLMYEAISGRPPFQGGLCQVLLSHMKTRPNEFAADLAVSKELEDIIFKALEKEPNDRWQTVKELREALEAVRTA